MRRLRGDFPAWLGVLLFGLIVSPAVAHARTCEVAVWLDSPRVLGALQFDLDYSGVAGSLATGPGGLACSGDATNALVIFGNNPADKLLTASVVSIAGFTGPQKLAHCSLEGAAATTAGGDFTVVVTDASNLFGQPVANLELSVVLPDCGDATTTTTTTTTSTTINSTTSTTTTSTTSSSTTSTTLDPCGNGIVDDVEHCDDGNFESDDGCEPDCTTDLVCGDANGNSAVQTSDALTVLRAAIGQPVSCPAWFCDADGDLKVGVSDSLRVLKRAVGQSVVMSCPQPAQSPFSPFQPSPRHDEHRP